MASVLIMAGIKKSFTYAQNPFPGKELKKLVIAIAIYIPNTEKNDKVVAEEEYKIRINQTQELLLGMFGGYTVLGKGKGEFTSKKGNRLNDKITRIVSYSSIDKFNDEKETLYDWLVKKKAEWSQESIAFEFEGDLYFI